MTIPHDPTLARWFDHHFERTRDTNVPAAPSPHVEPRGTSGADR